MREMLVLMMLIFEVVGCSDIRTNKHIRVDSAKTEPNSLNTDTQENFPKKFPVAAVKINFLGIAKDAEESWIGNLQGIQVSDSSGPYVFKQFISDTLSFQLIFYPKRFKKKTLILIILTVLKRITTAILSVSHSYIQCEM